jgi:DNA polymerase-3 subunit gamma/tau
VLAELLGLLHRLAVEQMVPGLHDQYEALDPREKALAAAVAAEEVHLFYQIGLLGQRDLELAPDPRTGLEMVLLRMLAFRPEGQSGQRTRPTQARQTDLGIHPGIRESEPLAPFATEVEPGAVRLANNEDWHTLVGQLGLRGITGQLANNCELDSWDGNILRLCLDANCANLRIASAEERFTKALQGRLGVQTQVQVRLARAGAETPAKRDTRRRAEQLQEAQRSMVEDPLVLDFQETFDAQLLTDSIRPLDRSKPS